MGSHCQITWRPEAVTFSTIGESTSRTRSWPIRLIRVKSAGHAVRVQAAHVLHGLFRGRTGADLDADGVGQQFGEGDVRAVGVPGALADPQEVGEPAGQRWGSGPSGSTHSRVRSWSSSRASWLVQISPSRGAGAPTPAMKRSPRPISAARARCRRPPGAVLTKRRFSSCRACASARSPRASRRTTVIASRAWRWARAMRSGSGVRGRPVGFAGVDDVAPVHGQPVGVDGRGAGLGVLSGGAGHRDHGQAGGVGEDQRHPPEQPEVGAQVGFGAVGEGLRAVAGLQQEGLAAGDGAEPVEQPPGLGGRDGVRRRVSRRDHGLGPVRVRPAGLLGGGPGQGPLRSRSARVRSTARRRIRPGVPGGQRVCTSCHRRLRSRGPGRGTGDEPVEGNALHPGQGPRRRPVRARRRRGPRRPGRPVRR